MIIAGVEQDVTMENLDMKTGPESGAAGMAGFAASPHLLYLVILSVFRAAYGSIFGRLQAVGRYVRPPQGRRTSRAPVLPLPILCLAVAFVCFSAIGALAQDGSFEVDWPRTHDGVKPLTMTIVFTSEFGFDTMSFTKSDITFAVPDTCTTCLPAGGNFERDYAPTASKPAMVMGSELRWTFTVTPGMHKGVSPDFSVTIPKGSVADVEGQTNAFPINQDSAGDIIIIKYMAPPSNVFPTADAGMDQTVTSGDTVTLAGSGKDDDGTVTGFSWTRTDGTSMVMPILTDQNTATPSFTADTVAYNELSMTHIFTLTVTDNDGDSSTDTVTITINPNARPTADAGMDQTVPTGTLVELAGSGTDSDSDDTTLTYAWEVGGGTTTRTVTLTGEDSKTPSFTPMDPVVTQSGKVTVILKLTVMDEDGDTHEDLVTVTVEEPYADPVADAVTANSEVASGTTVTLDGSGSSVDRRRAPIRYAWARAGGTGGTLSSTDEASPTFTVDLDPGTPDVTYTFTLTVTDMGTDFETAPRTSDPPARVSVVVQPDPKADAGLNRTVRAGDLVTLNGSDSRVDRGRSLTYAWTLLTGADGGTGTAPVDLSSMTAEMPTFTAPGLAVGVVEATYIFQLIVTDNAAKASAPTTVTITVVPANAVPVANAGAPQTVAPGMTVTLVGSGTDSDGDDATLIYAWARADGTIRGLTNADKAQASFIAEPPTLDPGADDVEHIFTLTVTDDEGGEGIATVKITVNAPPKANAGAPQTVASGTPVMLNGEGSDDTTGGIASYAWTRADGTTRGLTNEDMAIATFTPDLADGADDVEHIFTLTVTDNQGAIDTDTVTITVTSNNAAPVAKAGEDDTVHSDEMVILRGSGSDIDSDDATLTYAWTRADGTTTGLTNADMATASFRADILDPGADDVEHIFTLTVTDDEGGEGIATVKITVNAPPKANAGAPQTVASGTPVMLDGEGSDDTTGGIASYAWTRADGTTRGLTNEDMAIATFTPDLADGADDVEHIFTLTVTDNQGAIDTDTVTITVTSNNAAPVAKAGEDDTVHSDETVILRGSGSDIDSDDATLTYAWTRADGTTTGLTNADMATASFRADTLDPGADDVEHIFTLTVTDDEGATGTDTVTITVTAFSVDIVLKPSDLKVQEGGSGTYRVRLSESPGREMIIMATSGNEAVVRLKNTRLVFNAGNWNDWQEVEVNAVADSVKNDDRIKVTITHSIGGVASNQLGTVTVTVRAQEDDPILDHVGQFIATRATALLGQQPDLIRFLKQDGPTAGDGGAFTFQATDGRLSLDGGFIHDGTWGEVTGARINSETSDTESVLATFGIHRKYSETFLAGAMLQFDLADRDLSQQAGTIDGTGWLVGPYFVARHGSQPLYFEGRLLYGQSDNDIRFIDPYLGVRTGSFDSARLLAQIRVEGEIAVPGHGDDGGADALWLIPYADIRWVEDRAAAFTTVSATTGFRTPVLGQTVNISQLELGSNMVIPITVRTGSMILTGGLGLVLSNTEGDHIKSVVRGRGRGELGFSYGLDDNLQIGFDSFYDGIGASRYESYGLSLSAEMKF